MLDPRLFRIPGVRAGALGMMTAFFGSFGLFYLNATLLQYGRGYSVLQTGLAIVPMTLPMLLGSRWVLDMAERIGMAATLALALAAIGGGLLGLSTTAGAGYLVYLAWLMVVGVGLAMALPSLTVELTSALPPEQAGVGAGLQATTRELGSALGVAVVGTVLSAEFSHRMSDLLGSAAAPRTVTQALAATPMAQHPVVLQAFSSAALAALRWAGVVVLVAGALVVLQATRARRR